MMPWGCGPMLEPEAYRELRLRTMFDCCKWDPQCGDVPVLAPYPIVLQPATWNRLAKASESLATEMLAAEAELVGRPDLHTLLGIPRAIRAVLRGTAREHPAQSGPRFVRFDWHYTTEGWLISEANSDVPGGFIEAGGFTSLAAEHLDDTTPAGDPATALVNTLVRSCGEGSKIGLVHATAYTDDRQVMVYLSRLLNDRGMQGHLLAPDQIEWRDGRAWSCCDWHTGPIDLVFRFYPAEWLAHLPRRDSRQGYFATTRTPQSNPGFALLTQSKRFPLVWDRLKSPLPTWRRFLPETLDPRAVPSQSEHGWVFKPALGRVGEQVAIGGLAPLRQWTRTRRIARWFPSGWVAQRRFKAIPIATPEGDRYPCIGVFVVDGRAAGAYGRLAKRPLIDAGSQDVAVLIGKEPLKSSGASHARAVVA